MQGLMMDYPLTMDRILEHAARMFPRKQIATMLPDGSMHRYAYADMHRRVKRLSKALCTLGVQPGDRVATFAWNTYQHMELYFAIPGAGAVCHTLNIRLFPDQLAYIMKHADDRIVFVDATLLPLFERPARDAGCVGRVVLMNAPKGAAVGVPCEVLHYEDLVAGADEDFEWRSTDEGMAMGLCYTSGTTGQPKGALYSHRSMYLHTLGINQAAAIGLVESDIMLPVVPQFHAMAWGMPYAAAMAGAGLVMPGPHLKADALAMMIEQEQVTVAAGVPTIWTALYHELKKNPRDLSRLRSLGVGGAAMPRSLIEAFEKELGVSILHAWGMTETSPVGTVCRLQEAHEELSDAGKWDIKALQGYPIAGVEMRIVDGEGKELPWDGEQVGELQVRGPWVVRQYYRMEPSPESFTKDGWFRTGDVAAVTPDGYMRITDRTKDLVKSGGEWISSVELENALMAHPGVREAAVIAVPDEKWSERPLAVVVADPDERKPSQEELQGFLAKRVAKFWIPERFVFVEEIPKTSVGKFSKATLRKLYSAGQLE